MERTKFFIDLDSIFDTRQARLLSLKSEEEVANYILSENYNFRKIDDFSDFVNMEEYNKIEKDVYLIKKSTITFILNILKKRIMSLDVRNAYLQKPFFYEIILNLQDYKLTEKQVEAIILGINAKLRLNNLIIPVRMKEEEVTPNFLRSGDFAYVFIYNSQKWLDYNTIKLENIKLENTVMYFPAIYYNKDMDISKEEEKIRKIGFNDMFSFVEMMLSEKVKINFLPIAFYSNIIANDVYMAKFQQFIKNKTVREVFEDGNSSSEI